MHRLAVDATWAVTREVAVRTMIPQRSGGDLLHGVRTAARNPVDGARHLGAGRAGESRIRAGLEWSRYGIRTVRIAPGTLATEGMEQNYTAEDRAQ